MMSVRSIVVSRALYTNFEEGGCLTYIGREGRAYNSTASLALCCPLTTKIKGWPFEVDTETDLAGAKGVVLADQIKALDWRARNGELAARMPRKIVAEVLARLKALLPGI
jgi:mRNA interferase MazF